VKIAVVNPSAAVLELCQNAIHSLSGCEHIWSARTREEALKKASLSQPDLIILALELASECIKPLMKDFPCTIIVATPDVTNQASQVFEAMGAGALDVVTIELDESGIPKRLMEKICMIRLLMAKNDDSPEKTPQIVSFAPTPPLVAIGCSTGGPSALLKILKSFDNHMDFAVVVVQHVDEKFAPGLAEWLSRHTRIPVSVAVHGSVPQMGTVLIASANDHLVMTRNCRMRYTPYPIEKPYRPSVDVFFESLASYWPSKGTAILLTGMGNDGAKGMKLLRDAGWHTIAEHEESCVVYGMPKAAIELGAAVEVLPIEDIGTTLRNRVKYL
jgi:two-component system response regulator WspF